MRKYFCDCCKAELTLDQICEVRVPDKFHGKDYIVKTIEVCKDCKNHIELAVYDYDVEAVKNRFKFYKTLLPDLIDEV